MGAWAARISAAVGLGGVAIGLAMAPWFNWTSDALSDLGHPRNASSPAFNIGLVASGFLYLVFVAALWRALPSGRRASAAAFCLASGGLSLAGIGIINESFGAGHFVVSFTYFMFVPLGMAFMSFALWSSMRGLALLTLGLSAAAAFFGISIIAAIVYGAPFPSQAIPELIASAFLAGWSVYAGGLIASGRLAADARAETTGEAPSP